MKAKSHSFWLEVQNETELNYVLLLIKITVLWDSSDFQIFAISFSQIRLSHHEMACNLIVRSTLRKKMIGLLLPRILC